MIVITVQGERGEGKTVTAVRLVTYLRSLGFEVKYEGYSPAQTERMENLLRTHPSGVMNGAEPRKFVVRDDAPPHPRGA